MNYDKEIEKEPHEDFAAKYAEDCLADMNNHDMIMNALEKNLLEKQQVLKMIEQVLYEYYYEEYEEDET